eukprot:scaffold203406_cov17-Tisochrysis_lutea.AAC.2
MSITFRRCASACLLGLAFSLFKAPCYRTDLRPQQLHVTNQISSGKSAHAHHLGMVSFIIAHLPARADFQASAHKAYDQFWMSQKEAHDEA